MLLGSNKTVVEFDEMKIKDLDTHVSKKKNKKQQEDNKTQQNIQPKTPIYETEEDDTKI